MFMRGCGSWFLSVLADPLGNHAPRSTIALRLDLPPQLDTISAAFRPASFNIVQKGQQLAGFAPMGGPFREDIRRHIPANGDPSHPQLPGNLQLGCALGMERTHLGVALLPLAMPCLPGNLFVAGTTPRRHPVCRIGPSDILPLRPMRIKAAFSRFAQVPQDMPPIRDLHGLRCPLADAACILRRAITAHDLDPGILTQPVCQGGGRAIGQEIDDFVLIEVGDHRAIPMPAAEGKIINANDSWRRDRGNRYLTDEAA